MQRMLLQNVGFEENKTVNTYDIIGFHSIIQLKIAHLTLK